MGHKNEVAFFDSRLAEVLGPFLEVGSRRIDGNSDYWERRFRSDLVRYVRMDVVDHDTADFVGDVSDPRVVDWFGEASFGAIILASVLQHVPRIGNASYVVEKLLRVGGHLCVTVPFVWRYSPHPRGSDDATDCYRFSIDGLRATFPAIRFDDYAYSTEDGRFWKNVPPSFKSSEGLRSYPWVLLHAVGVRRPRVLS